MSPENGNGWNEYSRLVLEQLETLTLGIESIRNDMQDMKQELLIMKTKEDKVNDLKTWKEKIDEVASPTQMKEMVSDIQSLKEYKTKAITAFMVVQTIMALALAWSHIL